MTDPTPLPTPAESPAVQALAGADPHTLEAFWTELRRPGRSTPLLEPDPTSPAHRLTTFLWRGTPTTRSVRVLINRIADHRTPERGILKLLPGTDIWHLTFRLRADWRGSYQFVPDDDEHPAPADEDLTPATDPTGLARWKHALARAVPDPHNPHRIAGRWGATAATAGKSVAELPDAPPQPWRAPRPNVPSGTLTEHRLHSQLLGNERTVWLYTPADLTAPADPSPPAPLPVLILLDGEIWAREAPITPTLDNLIAAGRIPPLLAVLPESLPGETRRRELTCHAPFVDFLSDELLPWTATHHPITEDPARTVIAGQSLGGLTAVFATHHAPHRFARAASASGSFWWREPDDARHRTLPEILATAPRTQAAYHLAVGLQEPLLLDATRHLHQTLTTTNNPVTLTEYNGGHDYPCWQGTLAEALPTLLPTHQKPRHSTRPA